MGIKDLRSKASPVGNIELYGNKEIIVDGCKSVTDYGDSFIKLNIGEKNLKISGRELVVTSYIYEQANIKGEIFSLEFTTD